LQDDQQKTTSQQDPLRKDSQDATLPADPAHFVGMNEARELPTISRTATVHFASFASAAESAESFQSIDSSDSSTVGQRPSVGFRFRSAALPLLTGRAQSQRSQLERGRSFDRRDWFRFEHYVDGRIVSIPAPHFLGFNRDRLMSFVLVFWLAYQCVLLAFPLIKGPDACELVADNNFEWVDMRKPSAWLAPRAYCYSAAALLLYFPLWRFAKTADVGATGGGAAMVAVGRCIFFAWVANIVYATQYVFVWCSQGWFARRLYSLAGPVAAIALLCQQAAFTYHVVIRVRMVEAGFDGNPVWTRRLSWSSRALVCVGCLNLLFVIVNFIHNGTQSQHSHEDGADAYQISYQISWGVYDGIASVAFFLISFGVLRAFSRVILVLVPAARISGQTLAPINAEASWAMQELKSRRWVLATVCVLNALGLMATSATEIVTGLQGMTVESEGPRAWLLLLSSTLPLLFESVCLLTVLRTFQAIPSDVVSEMGSLQGAYPLEFPSIRSLSPSSFLPHLTGWQAKVQELAWRSMTVESILDLFERLGPQGDVMVHYDPWKSTTNDVVRQAIIPMSRTGSSGVSYADLVRGGRAAALPHRMVTHSWSNLFLHLVCTVLADALEKDEYELFAQQLVTGHVRGVRRLLGERGVIHQRYWLCIFCVNQHAGICGGFGRPPPPGPDFDSWDEKRRDTVTRQIYPVCGCKLPKVFNDQPEECEMNKFNDMMAYLHAQVPDFRQVLFIDPSFEMLTRAWCVAETVEAHTAMMPQKAVLESQRGFGVGRRDFNLYAKLVSLDVRNCDASRPEDKEEILARIDDVDRFNVQLQWIILGNSGGLLRERFQGFAALDAAARIARRTQWLSRCAPAS